MHHPAELTFYDELGIERSATPEEIRDSFRAIVRIVHPDHQTDQLLKEIAERQMRKLNRIYAVLSDPDKRLRYDQSLDRGYGPTVVLSPTSSVNVSRLMGMLTWAGAATLTLAGLIWLSSESPAARAPQTSERTPQPAGTTAGRLVSGSSADEITQLRADVRNLKLERDYAYREITRLRGTSNRVNIGMPEPVSLAPVPLSESPADLPTFALPSSVAPPPANTAPVRAAERSAPVSRPFNGFWFYMKEPPGKGSSSTLYPPEFIEATLTEQNGVVRGRYRSRYKIVDRAISPDVIFEFSGTASGNSVVAPWVGAGGAKGEITLRLAGDNSMKVDWNTTDPGHIQGLISGTATLMRRLD